jgi:hypothetical protein
MKNYNRRPSLPFSGKTRQAAEFVQTSILYVRWKPKGDKKFTF